MEHVPDVRSFENERTIGKTERNGRREKIRLRLLLRKITDYLTIAFDCSTTVKITITTIYVTLQSFHRARGFGAVFLKCIGAGGPEAAD